MEDHLRPLVFRKELANLTQLPGKERKPHGIFVFPELLEGFSAGEPGWPVSAELAPCHVPPSSRREI